MQQAAIKTESVILAIMWLKFTESLQSSIPALRLLPFSSDLAMPSNGLWDPQEVCTGWMESWSWWPDVALKVFMRIGFVVTETVGKLWRLYVTIQT